MRMLWQRYVLLWSYIVGFHIPVAEASLLRNLETTDAARRVAAARAHQVSELRNLKSTAVAHRLASVQAHKVIEVGDGDHHGSSEGGGPEDAPTRAQQTKEREIEVKTILVVLGIICLIGLMLSGAWYWSNQQWKHVVHSHTEQQPGFLARGSSRLASLGHSRSGTEEFDKWCDCWVELAKTGELDIYTCMGLRNGFGHFGPRTQAFLPVLALLFSMQFVLPMLLAVYEFNQFQWHAEKEDMTFRCIAFILYVFSILHLYFGALDDCRTMFLEMAFEHNVSWWFLIPMLFGEFLNSFTSFVLTSTLFMVFCVEHSAVELVIKAIAINFVVEIDNDWTTLPMRKDAIEDFERFRKKVPEWDAEEEGPDLDTLDFVSIGSRHDRVTAGGSPKRTSRNCIHTVVRWMCIFMRVFGTLCVGGFLALIMLLAHQKMLCEELSKLSMGLSMGRFGLVCDGTRF